MMFTEFELPIRSAPDSIRVSANSRVRTPPEALTPGVFPTVLRSNLMSSTVAPLELIPVEVFTKVAPAAIATVAANTFSSSVSSEVSSMVFTSMPFALLDIACISLYRTSHWCSLAAAMFITISISSAP